jgi:aldehyde:ferredoxin oxidoreductase
MDMASFACMGKFLRINLSDGKIIEEPMRDDWVRKFIGGAGLASWYLYEAMPAGTDPLGPENPLIFMTGLLTGTASPSSGRYSVVSKSPLTGIWGQANSGGSFGPALKRSGFDGIIFEGISPQPVYLKIIDGHAELRDASHLWGLKVPDTEDQLQKELNGKATIASIGPAGENLVRYAAIMNNKHRAAGRCGLGAVMGAKRLKAIVCAGNARIRLAEGHAFNQEVRKKLALLDESLLRVGFEAFGTNMISDLVNVRGGYPTRNWQQGVFEDIEEVNGEGLSRKVLIEGVNCFACPVKCGRRTEIREGKWQGHDGEGPEYETANMLGAMCGNSDMNAITMANYLCNEYGLDTISAGSSIAFAMECYEKGILTKGQTGGLELRFGDSDLVVDLIGKIAHREGVGDLLAEGTRVMSQRLGRDSEHFAMHVKGLELPAYDPRSAKICGLGYVTANRGGDHITAYIEGPTFFDMPFLLIEDSSIHDPFVANPQEARVLIDLENALTMFDSAGGCKFMGILLTAEDYVAIINTAAGWNLSVDDFRKSGERIYNLGRALCVREGITRKEDALPPRLMLDPLPDRPAKGMVISHETIEMLKDAYYEMRGWDKATGIPTAEKLRDLELDEFIDELWGK